MANICYYWKLTSVTLTPSDRTFPIRPIAVSCESAFRLYLHLRGKEGRKKSKKRKINLDQKPLYSRQFANVGGGGGGG